MKMPDVHPNTNHMLPYWLSDSPEGIRRARKNVPRGRTCFKDLNEQPLMNDVAFIHYATPDRNGYRFIQVRPFKRRPLTDKELHREFKYWSAREFKKLRRTRRAGLSYESRVKPMLFKRGILVCKRYNVIPCVEIKNPFSVEKQVAHMSAVAKSLGWQALYMALYKMVGIERKAKAVIDAGEQFAILAHGEKRPILLPPHTEIWGHFS